MIFFFGWLVDNNKTQVIQQYQFPQLIARNCTNNMKNIHGEQRMHMQSVASENGEKEELAK